MGGKRTFNSDDLPIGALVKVHAPVPMDGSDHEWHRTKGIVIAQGPWTLVRMVKRRRGWPSNDVLICTHNLRLM
jgi:hypothetical protein